VAGGIAGIALVGLVPKQSLGTQSAKLCFASAFNGRCGAAKQSFAAVRSQAELGNEKQ